MIRETCTILFVLSVIFGRSIQTFSPRLGRHEIRERCVSSSSFSNAAIRGGTSSSGLEGSFDGIRG